MQDLPFNTSPHLVFIRDVHELPPLLRQALDDASSAEVKFLLERSGISDNDYRRPVFAANTAKLRQAAQQLSEQDYNTLFDIFDISTSSKQNPLDSFGVNLTELISPPFANINQIKTTIRWFKYAFIRLWALKAVLLHSRFNPRDSIPADVLVTIVPEVPRAVCSAYLTRPDVRLRWGRPVSQYAGCEGCAGWSGAWPHA